MRTVHDLRSLLLEQAGGQTDSRAVTLCQRAIQLAYSSFMHQRAWVWLQGLGRLRVYGPYSTGTVAYSASTRQLTLTGGTWPTYLANGTVFGSVTISNQTTLYDVASRVSDTVIVLDEATAPVADITAGAAYRLTFDRYALPVTVRRLNDVVNLRETTQLTAIPVQDYLRQRYAQVEVSEPYYYCLQGPGAEPVVGGDGRWQMRLYPLPDRDYLYDYAYERQARELVMASANVGTVALTQDSPTATFSNASALQYVQPGMVFRLGTITDEPSSVESTTPYVWEAIVVAKPTSTTLTLDRVATATVTNTKYLVSDLLDVEPTAMYAALVATAEADLANLLSVERDVVIQKKSLAQQRMMVAYELDNRTPPVMLPANYRRIRIFNEKVIRDA